MAERPHASDERSPEQSTIDELRSLHRGKDSQPLVNGNHDQHEGDDYGDLEGANHQTSMGQER